MECAKRKLHIPDDMEKKGEIEVPQFFIDSNHHMNNEKDVYKRQGYGLWYPEGCRREIPWS